MFASRLPAHLTPSALAQLIAELRAGGTPLLDLTEANPSRAGFAYPERAIRDALGDPRAMVYQPDPLGLPAAREAVAEMYGVTIDRVALTASTSEAYSWLFKLLCDLGDDVLIPRPSYPLFELLAGLEGVRTVPYPLRYHEGWFIDFPALIAAITPRTRAIVVVNPNNPTGSYLKREEHANLESICERNDLALISDEVFADYALTEDASRVPTLVNAARVLTFSLNGLSKLAGLPQMKLGWIILSGPEHLQRAAAERLEMIADTYLSVSTPVQWAAPALLAARVPLQRQILERITGNLEWLRKRTASSAASLLEAEGGWCATLRMPRTRTEEEWVTRAALDRHVLVQPGYFYDFESEAFLVLSLLTPGETFRAGVDRLLEDAG